MPSPLHHALLRLRLLRHTLHRLQRPQKPALRASPRWFGKTVAVNVHIFGFIFLDLLFVFGAFLLGLLLGFMGFFGGFVGLGSLQVY